MHMDWLYTCIKSNKQKIHNNRKTTLGVYPMTSISEGDDDVLKQWPNHIPPKSQKKYYKHSSQSNNMKGRFNAQCQPIKSSIQVSPTQPINPKINNQYLDATKEECGHTVIHHYLFYFIFFLNIIII